MGLDEHMISYSTRELLLWMEMRRGDDRGYG
jgi:hypothetical protein